MLSLSLVIWVLALQPVSTQSSVLRPPSLPSLELVLSSENLKTTNALMVVEIDSNASATVSLLVVFESSADAVLWWQVSSLAPPSYEVLRIQDAQTECLGYVVSWEHPSYRQYVTPGIKDAISYTQSLDKGSPTGRIEDYVNSATYRMELGENVRKAQRVFSNETSGRLRNDSLAVIERAEIVTRIDRCAQKIGNIYFADIRATVDLHIEFDLYFGIPSDANVVFFSSNLVRLRPNIFLAVAGRPSEQNLMGRFYVQYEWVDWYLRSPIKEMIIASFSGAFLVTIIREISSRCLRIAVDRGSITYKRLKVRCLGLVRRVRSMGKRTCD